ncbi:MAG: protein-L-isoaspartate(D-aspartate) O-methyltransferase [Bryobacteraceae bacterium]
MTRRLNMLLYSAGVVAGWQFVSRLVRGEATGARLAVEDPVSARNKMVREQIEARGVRHVGVLRAMRETPRHLFVPESQRNHAYMDCPLAIGHGQTISQPYIVGSMSELLDPQPRDRVLEIGTGSGYQAAILSQLAQQVYSIEIVEPLAIAAAELLQRLGYRNVTVRCGNGWLGWPEQAPFDRIILTAAPPDVPPALIQQLRPGGRLVAPVGDEWQELVVIDKDASGKIHSRNEYPVMFVPMVGKPK